MFCSVLIRNGVLHTVSPTFICTLAQWIAGLGDAPERSRQRARTHVGGLRSCVLLRFQALDARPKSLRDVIESAPKSFPGFGYSPVPSPSKASSDASGVSEKKKDVLICVN